MEFYAEIPPMAQMLGKELQSTWWSDYRVGAEYGGLNGIKDTYKRGLTLAKEDKVYGTEFALVLNWLSWFYADENIRKKYPNSLEKSKLFADLYCEFDDWVLNNWPKDWKDYYLQETD